MSSPVAVVGDGTTVRHRASARWRRWRFPVALALVVAAGGLLAALPEPRTSTVPFAPDNPGAGGSRALAQILGRQGVEVRYVRSFNQARAAAVAGSTLLVVDDTLLTDEQARSVATSDADLVLVDAPWLLSHLSPTAGAGPQGTAGPREAGCDDPDAVAAGTITAASSLTSEDDSWVACFPAAGEGAGTGAYLVRDDGTRTVAALADGTVLTNDALDERGNAALALRVLGRHEHLTWYLPSLQVEEEAAGPGLADLVPPWARVLALQLLVVAGVAALWRGRRLGPVVAETLPVVVPATETTLGRARLYRRGRAHGRAAAALRAGTAVRLAQRLGLPRSAPAPAVIDAVARAARRPPDEVAALLYGPPPTDDAALARLARALDQLEDEVHRP